MTIPAPDENWGALAAVVDRLDADDVVVIRLQAPRRHHGLSIGPVGSNQNLEVGKLCYTSYTLVSFFVEIFIKCTLYLRVIDRFEHLNDEVLFHSTVEASYATNF